MRKAIDKEQKQLRREHILRRAESLLDPQAREIPTVARIAVAAGLSKGTMYLYFKTREEVYLHLYHEGMQRLVEVQLAALASGGDQVQKFASATTEFAVEAPLTLFMADLSGSVLLANLSQDVFDAHWQLMRHLSEKVGHALAESLDISDQNGEKLWFAVQSMMVGYWGFANPPAATAGQASNPKETKIVHLKQDLYEMLVALQVGAQRRFAEQDTS